MLGVRLHVFSHELSISYARVGVMVGANMSRSITQSAIFELQQSYSASVRLHVFVGLQMYCMYPNVKLQFMLLNMWSLWHVVISKHDI